MPKTPVLYPLKDGKPQLRNSFVLLLDILGYSELARSADSAAKQHELLASLRRALSEHRPRLTPLNMAGEAWYAVKAFTDNIVLARPIHDDGESELGHMMLNASDYQLALAREGFFVRGAITVGHHFMDEYVVFGPALIEAYELETRVAVYPRIVLSPGVREYVKKHVSYYAHGAAGSPHNNEILIDADGEWFVNYLDGARFDNDPAILDAYLPYVEQHAEQVKRMVLAAQGNKRVLEKYLWTGRYHNFVGDYLFPGKRAVQIPAELLAQSFERLATVLRRKQKRRKNR